MFYKIKGKKNCQLGFYNINNKINDKIKYIL